MVAASGCLFCGVQGFCVKCKGTFTALSLMLFPVWHLLIVIDRRASSDWSPGSMFVWVHCILCVVFIGVSFMGWHRMGSLHCVCVWHMMYASCWGSSLVSLAFVM